MVLLEYRVGLLTNRATVTGDDSSRERNVHTFVSGNETSTMWSFRSRGESAWERNVPVPADITSRPRLRPTSSRRYKRQRTCLKFGERSFSCSGPRCLEIGAVCHHAIISHHCMNSRQDFQTSTKIFLFQQAYQQKKLNVYFAETYIFLCTIWYCFYDF